MADIQQIIHTSGQNLLHWLWLRYYVTRLTFVSIFYNDFANKYYIGDTLMEPMFWFVDHFTKVLGPICVAAVIISSSSLIAIAYIIGLPFYLNQNIFILAIALVIGHWLLVNVVFYYYMAFTTEPGYPPQGAMITEAISICKRCIAPKPPRTHHCIVCNCCILKMDHHCPWLNNCIGHFNHRYFFMFCLYSWIGIVFVIAFGIPVAHEHFFGDKKNRISSSIVNFIHLISSQIFSENASQYSFPVQTLYDNSTNISPQWPETLYHSCIVYVALLCIAVFFVLGGLLVWHTRLISKGETSIESHINKKEKERLLKERQVFQNPYDFGPKKNWKIFLGLGYYRPWWHILLPIFEDPVGDGVQWNMLPNGKWDYESGLREIPRTCTIKIS